MRLFALLAALLAICACKKPTDGLGQNLLPGSDELYTFSNDTTPLLVENLLMDTEKLPTDQSVAANVLVGRYTDSATGIVEAHAYFQMDKTIPSTFTPQSVADSLVLTLVCRDSAIGDISPMTFSLESLATRLTRSNTYFASDVAVAKPGNLIAQGFETVRLQKIAAGYLLRLKLSATYASKLMRQAQNAQDGEFIFLDREGNYVLKCISANSAILSMDMKHELTKLTMYYRENVNGTLSDQKLYNFSVNDNCEAFTHTDYSPAGALSGINSTTGISAQQNAFLLSGTIAYLKVDFSALNWLNERGPVIVNNAKLILPIESNKYGNIYTVLAYDSISNGTFKDVHKISIGSEKTGLGYYELSLTNYCQRYINGELDDAIIYIVPDPREYEFGSRYYHAKQTRLHGPQYSNDKTQNMRFAITYTFD